jgi:hypothetical protein
MTLAVFAGTQNRPKAFIMGLCFSRAKTKSRTVELRGPSPAAKHAGFFSSDPGTA